MSLQVPGLCRASSMDCLSTTKIKPLVPARVSGLSKKPGSIQKRKQHRDAENKPGLQIKISELWKNFGFKKWVSVLARLLKQDRGPPSSVAHAPALCAFTGLSFCCSPSALTPAGGRFSRLEAPLLPITQDWHENSGSGSCVGWLSAHRCNHTNQCLGTSHVLGTWLDGVGNAKEASYETATE